MSLKQRVVKLRDIKPSGDYEIDDEIPADLSPDTPVLIMPAPDQRVPLLSKGEVLIVRGDDRDAPEQVVDSLRKLNEERYEHMRAILKKSKLKEGEYDDFISECAHATLRAIAADKDGAGNVVSNASRRDSLLALQAGAAGFLEALKAAPLSLVGAELRYSLDTLAAEMRLDTSWYNLRSIAREIASKSSDIKGDVAVSAGLVVMDDFRLIRHLVAGLGDAAKHAAERIDKYDVQVGVSALTGAARSAIYRSAREYKRRTGKHPPSSESAWYFEFIHELGSYFSLECSAPMVADIIGQMKKQAG